MKSCLDAFIYPEGNYASGSIYPATKYYEGAPPIHAYFAEMGGARCHSFFAGSIGTCISAIFKEIQDWLRRVAPDYSRHRSILHAARLSISLPKARAE